MVASLCQRKWSLLIHAPCSRPRGCKAAHHGMLQKLVCCDPLLKLLSADKKVVVAVNLPWPHGPASEICFSVGVCQVQTSMLETR